MVDYVKVQDDICDGLTTPSPGFEKDQCVKNITKALGTNDFRVSKHVGHTIENFVFTFLLG